MGKRRKTQGAEWIGGLESMPAYVTGEGEPYQPELLLWVGADDLVLGSAVGKPGDLLGQACESLQQTIERPMVGESHTPTRVRVSSPELAEALRLGHPNIEVTCAPTPEVDVIMEVMRERMRDDAGVEQSYLSAEISVDAVASFFRAAAGLFRAAPWSVVPSDDSVFSITIEQLDLFDAALSVIGQMGDSLGFVLFADIDDFERFLEVAETASDDEIPDFPPHLALSFERGDDLGSALREEIAEHGWEVHDANAYPWIVAIEEGLVARPATAKELTIIEAIAAALPRALSAKKALADAWSGGKPVSRRVRVRTHAGELQVTVHAPFEKLRD
jgi:hypothetical protein